jgi:serine/threonine-protein kinase
MGVVFEAEDVRLKRRVALKFLSPDLAAQPRARDRFLREAQAAAALDNPHVCTVHEAGEDEGRAYIVMALLDGPSLKDRIAQGPLPIGEVLLIARQVAAGLAAAHAKSIVHRDIKPANVVLAGGSQATITDFGLAQVEGASDATRTGTVTGTLAYMSPEQLQGLHTDQRTDLWSLGCVIYEMLTGRCPFTGTRGRVDLAAVLQAAPRPIAALRPDAPAGLIAIVDRCLERDLRHRYQDVAALLADLESVQRPAAPPAAPALGGRHVPSLVVLPFVDMSPEKDQEYFAEGVAEEIIHALTHLRGLHVVARTSAFALKDKGLDVRDIGRALNVGAVLEGSVRTSGNRLRITAQLVDVADGFHLWSERFDREAGDVFAIQDEITQSVVEHLKVTLHVGEQAALQARPTVDPEAYALYLKGQYLLARPGPESLQTALRLFDEALARDPGLARAHVGIATAWGTRANFNLVPQTEAWPRAKVAIGRALALDPRLPEAHQLATMMAFWYEWDWAAAEAGFGRVLSLAPGNAYARGDHAWFLLNRRRYGESLEEIRRALALDPLSPLFYAWSVALHGVAGRLDEALADFARCQELDPAFGLPYFHVSVAWFRKHEFDKVMEALEQASQRTPLPGWTDAMEVIARCARGDRAAAARIYGQMVEQKRAVNVSSVCLAWAAGALGDSDAAFEWFERAFAERDSLMAVFHNYTDFMVPALTRDPRYLVLLEQMKLTDVASRS